MVSAPLAIQATLGDIIPADHWAACVAAGTPMRGNAAGNTLDLLDLTGQSTSPAPLPQGFTARGIVALVFSCISAVLGMIAIAWYGLAPLTTASERKKKEADKVARKEEKAAQKGRAAQVGVMPMAVAAKRGGAERMASQADLEAEMRRESGGGMTMVDQRRLSRGSSHLLEKGGGGGGGGGEIAPAHHRGDSRGSSNMLDADQRRISRGSSNVLDGGSEQAWRSNGRESPNMFEGMEQRRSSRGSSTMLGQRRPGSRGSEKMLS